MDKKVRLQIDGQDIPMNAFVSQLFIRVIEALVDALDKVPVSRQKIDIQIESNIP